MSQHVEEERRIRACAIARDVLLHHKEYRLATGSYMTGDLIMDELLPDDLQDIVDDVIKSCNVCALGACLLSKARLYDEVPCDKIVLYDRVDTRHVVCATDTDVFDNLRDAFSDHQMIMIESAFERGVMQPNRSIMLTDAGCEIRGAVVFGSQFTSAVDRLFAIMTNIVDNDGVFVVEPVQSLVDEDEDDEDEYDEDDDYYEDEDDYYDDDEDEDEDEEDC